MSYPWQPLLFEDKPEALEAASRAFEMALAFIGDSASPDHQADLLTHVLELAQGGELDAERLCEQAFEASMGLDPAMVTFTGL